MLKIVKKTTKNLKYGLYMIEKIKKNIYNEEKA